MTRENYLLLEAEVNQSGQANFESRYQTLTESIVSPGSPEHYQSQPNKWGAELRIYFNDEAMASDLRKSGIHVEDTRHGYKSGEYKYRVNNSDLWWKMVDIGLRLGSNQWEWDISII